MVGGRVPAGNWPFDPVAAEYAQSQGNVVHICNGRNLKLVGTLLRGLVDENKEIIKKMEKKRSWTTITPSL